MNAWNGQFLQFLIVGNEQFHAEFRRGCQVNRIGGRYRRGRSNNAISIRGGCRKWKQLYPAAIDKELTSSVHVSRLTELSRPRQHLAQSENACAKSVSAPLHLSKNGFYLRCKLWISFQEIDEKH